MNDRQYKKLINELKLPEDIEKVSKRHGITREMALVLYTQNVIYDTKRRFYKIKGSSAKMYKKWTKGTSLLQLAESHYFPPILTGKLILAHHGIPRKTYNSYVRDQSLAKDPRIRREMTELVKKDIIYSEEGNQVQRERGLMAEAEIGIWLEEMGVGYYHENDLREMGHQKTPDFKLKVPIIYKGLELNWIESKASFGDRKIMRENYTKQLKPYRRLFGPGMVIYWFGFIVPYKEHQNIIIANRSVLIDYGNISVKKVKPEDMDQEADTSQGEMRVK